MKYKVGDFVKIITDTLEQRAVVGEICKVVGEITNDSGEVNYVLCNLKERNIGDWNPTNFCVSDFDEDLVKDSLYRILVS